MRGPSGRETAALYLDLLEKALLHTLYFPPDVRDKPAYADEPFRKAFMEEMEKQRRDADEPGPELTPAEQRQMVMAEQRAQGRDWPVYAQTMIGVRRLRNVRRCVQTVIDEGVPGDLIEAGCWRGGASILMRAVLKANGVEDRTVFAADSFQGLPEPNPELYPADEGDLNFTTDQLAASLDEVRGNFERYGLLDGQVRFLEGWFKDTLPTVADRQWAVLRLDGDLYESTMDGLRNLYDGLSMGGFVIIDDFVWDNCRAAVEDFRAERGITDEVTRIDWAGAFWRREHS